MNMRKSCLIGLAGLLAGSAWAQPPRARTEVPLRVAYTTAALLSPDTRQAELAFPVDSPIQASVSVLSASPTLQVTLLDPGGGEHQDGYTDGLVAAGYVVPVGAGSSGGRSHNFDLKSPVRGVWKVRLAETDFGAPRAAILTVYNIGGVGVALLSGGRDYTAGQPVSLGLIVADEQGGLPRSSVSSLTASIRAEGGGPAIPVTFADDGAGRDPRADDGLYQATFTVATAGSYNVAAKVEGVRNGVAFARTLAGSFRVVTPCGTIQPGVQSRMAGNNDSLELTFSVNASRAGTFRLAATLSAPSGQSVALSKTAQLAGGLQAVTLSFPPAYLQALGVNGPYQVSQTTLSCVENDGRPEVDVYASDQRTDLGATMPFEVARAGRVEVTPPQLDFGTVAAGQTVDRQLWVANKGTGVLAVNSLAIDNAAFSVVAGAAPFTLLPNESRAVTLRFTAASGGAQTGTLVVNCNDAAGAAPTILLTAAVPGAPGPRAEASPATLDFGAVTVGQSRDLTLTVRNSGGAGLRVSSLAADNPRFSVTAPTVPFTLAVGEQQTVTVRFSAGAVGPQTGTLSIVTDDPSGARLSISLVASGVAAGPSTAVMFSDSFNRADADRCSLGALDNALGGSGRLYYLPVFPNVTPANPLGANIVSNALQNNGKGYGGVQFAASADSCSSTSIRGKDIGQDMNLRVDVLVPGDSSGRVTQAGPYFRSRPAARGDGILGGDSAGYWVQLHTTGQVTVKNLNNATVVASSAKLPSFDATRFHTLEVAVQGTRLQVALDGRVLTFSPIGAPVTTITIPPTGGSNYGTAGIAFGSDGNPGQLGGQRADNLSVTVYRPLAP